MLSQSITYYHERIFTGNHKKEIDDPAIHHCLIFEIYAARAGNQIFCLLSAVAFLEPAHNIIHGYSHGLHILTILSPEYSGMSLPILKEYPPEPECGTYSKILLLYMTKHFHPCRI